MFSGFRKCIFFLEKVNTALQKLENPKVLLKDPVRPNEGPMKDHGWSWTLLRAALVSLESLDMILNVYNAKIWPI